MAKYFVSFTSTFESLLEGKLSPSDLSDGFLVFGCRRDHVLVPYDKVPIEVLMKNKIKTTKHEKASMVDRKLIDGDVLEMWDHFAAQIRKANLETRLMFMHKIGHPSYRHFCRDTASQGDQVFWNGEWVKCEQTPRVAPAAVEIEATPTEEAVPDDAFFDMILSETSTGSIQGFAHGQE